jgi:hypothetical protein
MVSPFVHLSRVGGVVELASDVGQMHGEVSLWPAAA